MTPRRLPVGGLPRDIWVHTADANLAARAARVAEGLRLADDYPEDVREFDDVFVIPGETTSCLYDREGLRIPESCVRRGDGLADYIGASAERIEPPSDYATVAAPALYLSSYFRHWGHFLTESISRLWARHAYPELRGMDAFFDGFKHGFTRHRVASAFLGALSTPLNILPPRGVARVAKCFVPAPSFVNRAAAWAGHLAVTRDVATTHGQPAREARPVYLSRSRLENVERVVVNEREFEAMLARAGVEIAHPQEMPLAAQIALFNSRVTLICCAGSAQHNLMFVREGARLTTHILCEADLNRNCLMIDAIVGNASHYVHALRPSEREGAGKRIEIDLAFATDYFRGAGVL
jgi:hypothetical protein